jgi:glycosyltransferase involved in cell wall biosynthesis/predicted deacetylase
MSGKTRVLFLINSLAAGGAERQLSLLARGLDPDRFEVHVAVLYAPGYHNGGELWPDVASIPGISLHNLRKRKGALGYLLILPRLLRLVLRTRPHVLHGYMQGNPLLLLMGRLMRTPVVWGIRRSSCDLSKLDRLSLRVLRLTVWLSRYTDLVIFNSETGSRNYQSMGMRAPRMRVIPNGFDVDRFAPDPAKGAAQRRAWGVPEGVPLVGIVGRLDPVKDHPTFLRMAGRLLKSHPEAWFICVGDGGAAYRASLQAQASSLGIADRTVWPGVCLDMPAAYNALSLLALTSTDEGFPNVLGEAMACGVPCIATPAGDAALLVGETGFIRGFGDDAALAEAASTLLMETGETKAARASDCRSRILTTFSIAALVRNTAEALREVVEGDLPRPAKDAHGVSGSAFWPFRGPRYLIRFDDICPTMDWKVWNAVEDILVAQGIKPILAVVPDNRDPKLMLDPPAPDFWDRVRAWQSRGWAIGLHGYQHRYVNGDPGILRISGKSEFAGLDYGEQHEKLRLGLEIFQREGVRVDAWVAPSHSFDWTTVEALAAHGVRTISDGMAFHPYRDARGTAWVPQQSALMRAMPWGVWTFCYHSLDFQGDGLETFKRRLARLAPRMITLQEAEALATRSSSMPDKLVWLARRAISGARHLARPRTGDA